ncbi:amino acid adenylation domain-containing protein [Solwaraspora sp. WMMD1047]|uniref:amino acid adenylation domain-containing protein n=1 Tax=Solwaraspora sp. WMMD1047 TaxID=3016102 RepID=UPI0024166806|nr:amino acid adenylation domain-containing protein [Solwaraspora sp. WMMD1047]MDG4827789.1 amino acid adenylation domain-containing protein [Solwaraspora sp. WMMD1047]
MSLHELLSNSARRHPDRPAVTGPTGELSYAELDRQADELALVLADRGVRAGDRVVVWADKSPRVVVATQAVLRLGAAYVPATGATPAARVAAMAGDCAARAVCAGGDELARLTGELDDTVARVDLAAPTPPAAGPVHTPVGPDDLAYILYTSGSTGRPKGVCVSHRNARAFVDWAVTELAAVPADRFANHAPLTFDLSVLDLYAAFAVGAAVVLIPAELGYAPEALVDVLHDERITVWYSVPSALIFMIRDGGLLDRPAPAALRALLFAGEPFPIPYVRSLAGWTRARLLNLYGPTETNVCTFHQVTADDLGRDRPVPIGRASCGNTVWARQPDGTPAGPGGEGELLVDGPTVMLGYWGRPAQVGPYPTGDIVRVLPDGGFDYLGRTDHMVKVRGNRVELGEVEAVLAAHPDVAEAAVVLVGQGVEAVLVAHLVGRPGSRPAALSVRGYAARRLPLYMVPGEIRIVPELPRTRNGKIDRTALADGSARRADTDSQVPAGR